MSLSSLALNWRPLLRRRYDSPDMVDVVQSEFQEIEKFLGCKDISVNTLFYSKTSLLKNDLTALTEYYCTGSSANVRRALSKNCVLQSSAVFSWIHLYSLGM